MSIENLSAYEVIEHRFLNDVQSDSYLLRHKKTGAMVALMPNDDKNKVFYIGFRTPPKDSTGVAHIVEHTVLCGSKKFPLKDPFIELCKGSLNTFLNAMTYPDKTVYPVASLNDFDFQNLMEVYLDAVFYPNIYKEEKIFRQEGWHYEMESEDDELKINGVVYSEMKGAFSDPDDILERKILENLYPDTPYSVESGGDPDVIPSLTYEDFLAFHSKFYHPSNSYIFLYGNADMEEKLEFIDKEYLSSFDKIEVDSSIPVQKPFKKIVEVNYDYPITEDEDEEDKTYLNLSYSIGDYLDKELPIVLRAFEYAFSGNPAAPLRKALLEAGIGNEVYAVSDCSIAQNGFGFYAKGANASDKDEFVRIINAEFQRILKEGFDKQTLLAFLSREEFKYREADFGKYPKGLVYGLDLLDSWLYDDKLAFYHIECLDTYKFLKEQVNTDYFEKILKKCFVDNNHAVLITGVPKKGLGTQKENQLKDKLDAYKKSLDIKDIKLIVENTRELKEYQEAEDSQENLSKIKLLEVSDIDKEIRKSKNCLEELNGVKYLKQNINTCGIAYLSLYFNIDHIELDDLVYLPILINILGRMDTSDMKYGEISNELKLYTGGMCESFYAGRNIKTGDLSSYFVIDSKFLYENGKKYFDILKQVTLMSVFSDRKKLKEYIGEMRSQGESMLIGAPHTTAITRATSTFEEQFKLNDIVMGIDAVRFVRKIDDNFDNEYEKLVSKLDKLCKLIFVKENLFINLTSPKDKFNVLDDLLVDYMNQLPATIDNKNKRTLKLVSENEGFSFSGQVQYVAISGEYKSKGLKYHGAFNVLKTILGYDYLWNNVRVKGGAYGCFANFSMNGLCSIVSYRDPHLNNTLNVYRNLVNYLKNFDCTDRQMNQFIIGAFSDMDMPLTPSIEGKTDCTYFLNDVSDSVRQSIRDEVLHCTKEDIRALAMQIEAAFEDNHICVVGSEKKIKENSKLFDKVSNLI